MDDVERKYRDDMQWLEAQLAGIDKQIKVIAERIENGAILAYPQSFSDAELSSIQAHLTKRTDEILDAMMTIHKAFNEGDKP